MSSPRNRRNHAAWIGPLLSLLGIVTYFAVSVRIPDIRDSALPNLALVALGGLIALWGVIRRRNWKSWIGVLSAAFLGFIFFGYIYGYSAQLPSPSTAPLVGEMAPPLELPDSTGRVVSLDSIGGTRVLVVFYRGYW
jgi:peptidoglycan/LPS O-acetylase OafA/YrhL